MPDLITSVVLAKVTYIVLAKVMFVPAYCALDRSVSECQVLYSAGEFEIEADEYSLLYPGMGCEGDVLGVPRERILWAECSKPRKATEEKP